MKKTLFVLLLIFLCGNYHAQEPVLCSNAPQASTTTPVSSTVCLNGIVTLSPNVVPASTITGISYQWEYSNSSALGPFIAIQGATTSIYTTPQNTVTTWYQVVMTCTNGGSASTSSPAVVYVSSCPTSPCFNSPGATTATPVSSTVCMNGIVTLSPSVVPASSVTGVSYQWGYSTVSSVGPFTSIPGATTAIYNTPPNTVDTWYNVVMTCTNAGVSITSSAASVSVTTCPGAACSGAPGASTVTPVASTVCMNGIVTLSPNVVPASTVTGIGYQWEYSTGSAVGPYSSIAGATTAIYISPQNTVNTWYRIVMTCTNGGSSSTSSPAAVTVSLCNLSSPCTGSPPSATATPVSSVVCMNGIVTLSPNVVPASTITGISYQWQYSTQSSLGPYTAIPGATTAIYPSPQNTATTWYQVIMTCTNGGSASTSSPAVVYVTNCNSPCFNTPGATTATPVSNTVCVNSIVTFSPSVVPASTVTGVAYQWSYSTISALGPYISIAGATTAIYNTPPNTVTTWYHVVMTCTNAGIPVTSSPAVVNVTTCQPVPCAGAPAPSTATPVSSTVCVNGIVTLSPSVMPASTLTGISYQWQNSTISALGPYSAIPGATTAIYPSPQNAVTTWYQVVMTCTNGGAFIVSAPAVVNVSVCNQPGTCSGAPGASTITPVSSTVCMNGVVTLSPNVVPSSTTTGVSYQWQYSNNSAIGPYLAITGATNAILISPQNTSTTWYQVVMTCTNGGNASTSSPAVVNVTVCNLTSPCFNTPGTTTATPVSNTVCMNGIVTLSPSVVPASSVTGVSYQWSYSNNSSLGPFLSIPGATTAIFTTGQNSVTTWYQVTMVCNNAGNLVYSSPAVVYVSPCTSTVPCAGSPGASTATPVSNTVCMNGVVTLSPNVVPASTLTGISYQWEYSTGSALGPYTSIAGATTAIFTSPQNTVTTWYRIVMTCSNGGSASVSSPALVSVFPCNPSSLCFNAPGASTAIPVSNTVCINGVVTLSPNVVPASTVTGVSYQWQSSTSSALGPYTSISGATTAIFTSPPNTVTTWYQVIMICSNGGNSTVSSPAIVYVNNCSSTVACSTAPGATTATPVSNTVCLNGTVTLSPSVVPAASVTGISYQWEQSANSAAGPYSSIAGATTAIYTTPQNTVSSWYRVVITCVNGGNPSLSSPAKVLVSICGTVTGIYNPGSSIQDLKIYPVPAKEILTVEMPGGDDSVLISIFSPDGREVSRERLEFKNGRLSVDLNGIQSGAYIIQLSAKNLQARKLFFIAR